MLEVVVLTNGLYCCLDVFEWELSADIAANYTIQLARPRKYRLKATLDMLLDALGVKHINAWTPEEIENLDDKAAKTYLEKLSIHTVDISNPEQRKAVVDKITAGAVTHAKAAGRQVVHDTANLNMVRDRQTGKIVSQPDFDSAPGLTNEQTRRMYKVTEEDFDASAGQGGGVVLGWARALVGEDNCAFCVMLASRGPVFKRETVLRSKDGRRYHRHCDCKAVLVVKGKPWESEQEYKRLKDLWQRTNEEEPGTYVDGRNGEEKTEDQIKHFMRLVSEENREQRRQELWEAASKDLKKEIKRLNDTSKREYDDWVKEKLEEAEESIAAATTDEERAAAWFIPRAFVPPWDIDISEERPAGTQHWGGDYAIRYRLDVMPEENIRFEQSTVKQLEQLGYVDEVLSGLEALDDYSQRLAERKKEKQITKQAFDKWKTYEEPLVAELFRQGAREIKVLTESSNLSPEQKQRVAREIGSEVSPDLIVDAVVVELKFTTSARGRKVANLVQELTQQSAVGFVYAPNLTSSGYYELIKELRNLSGRTPRKLLRAQILTSFGMLNIY